jgi:Tol biopolymer transport system component
MSCRAELPYVYQKQNPSYVSDNSICFLHQYGLLGTRHYCFFLRDGVYMMRPDDTEPRKISESFASSPSHDGRFLVEIDPDIERRDILYIRQLHTGKKIRSLKLKVQSMAGTSWSPDGRWIAYAGNALGPIKGHRMDTELFLISPDGRRHRQLPDQFGEKPYGFVWAADSQSVFYNLLATNRHEIWELNINGKQNPKKHKPFHEGARLLGTYPTYAFSPKGKQIAYTSHEGLFVADVDGANQVKVVENGGFKFLYQVDWSPNGKHLVFSASKKIRDDYGLYIFSFASKKVRPLISSQDSLPRRPRWVEDSLAVQPSNKVTVTWGAIKNTAKH